MNQLKAATAKAKEGLFDEAITILIQLYKNGIQSDADVLKVLPYYQKAGRYRELESVCQTLLIPQLENLNQSNFSHKCKEIQKSFLSLKLYKLYSKLALCAERENLIKDEIKYSDLSRSYFSIYEKFLAEGTKIEDLKEFKDIVKRYGQRQF